MHARPHQLLSNGTPSPPSTVKPPTTCVMRLCLTGGQASAVTVRQQCAAWTTCTSTHAVRAAPAACMGSCTVHHAAGAGAHNQHRMRAAPANARCCAHRCRQGQGRSRSPWAPCQAAGHEGCGRGVHCSSCSWHRRRTPLLPRGRVVEAWRPGGQASRRRGRSQICSTCVIASLPFANSQSCCPVLSSCTAGLNSEDNPSLLPRRG